MKAFARNGHVHVESVPKSMKSDLENLKTAIHQAYGIPKGQIDITARGLLGGKVYDLSVPATSGTVDEILTTVRKALGVSIDGE